MSNTFHNRHGPRRSAATTVAATPSTQDGASHRDTHVPEWMTERWMHCVEAEARKRLRHEVHGVGALRR